MKGELWKGTGAFVDLTHTNTETGCCRFFPGTEGHSVTPENELGKEKGYRETWIEMGIPCGDFAQTALTMSARKE